MAKRRKPYIYEYVTVLSITDGDTFNAEIDMGGRVYKKAPVRLKDVDTPELKSTVPQVAEKARVAKIYLESLLPIGTVVKIISKRLDKYGRFESLVFKENGDDINNLVLSNLK